MAPRSKRASRTRRVRRAERISFRLRTPGLVAEFEGAQDGSWRREVQQTAARWRYIVSNRNRWAGAGRDEVQSQQVLLTLSARAILDLAALVRRGAIARSAGWLGAGWERLRGCSDWLECVPQGRRGFAAALLVDLLRDRRDRDSPSRAPLTRGFEPDVGGLLALLGVEEDQEFAEQGVYDQSPLEDRLRLVRDALASRRGYRVAFRRAEAANPGGALKVLWILHVLDDIAGHGLAEVGIPFLGEEAGWELRVMPWEHLLASASKPLRRERPILVVRHLERPGAVAPQSLAARRGRRRTAGRGDLLFVTTAPGPLREKFTFDHEQTLFALNQGLDRDDRYHLLEDPTPEDLEDFVREEAPYAIHLTGVDHHQGRKLLGEEHAEADGESGGSSQPRVLDGVYLCNGRGEPRSMPAQDLARTLVPGRGSRDRPALVVCNTYYSAARVCALVVAEGAQASIGFNDEVPERLAEAFLDSFYRAWALLEHDTFRAFDLAWRDIRERGLSLSGSGIVLWVDESPIGAGKSSVVGAEELPAAVGKAWEQIQEERHRPARLEEGETPFDLFDVNIVPKERLNFSTLHNGQNLFDSFVFEKGRHGYVGDVNVEVEFSVGPQRFPYKTVIDVLNASLPLEHSIRVPLTWDYVRHIDEPVQSTVFVQVEKDETLIHRDTHSVTLMPVQEWRDTQRDGIWLPSFILPRDPCVERIIDQAKRYLRSLTDDVRAGFDGYQGVDPSAPDPEEPVDLQVRAIWSALVNEFDITYINPPPSSEPESQRLRTPSQVIESGSGTCIDLALLLASCLEYVEIHPVIFLLLGHACVGYWRSEEAYNVFLESGADPLLDVRDEEDEPELQVTMDARWIVGEPSYKEIVSLVREELLIPLEATGIARRIGFSEAYEEGAANLDSPDDFDFAVDVALARANQVFPLPF